MVSIQPISSENTALQIEATSATKHLSGNKTFLIHNPQDTWEIEFGSVGIFAVSCQQGNPTGPRRYLFTVNEHELLLGCVPRGYGLIAIAFEPTTLHLISSACVKANHQIRRDQTHKLATWFNHFSEISGFPQPPASSVQPREYISLEAGQTYLAEETLTWIKIKESDRPSSACWLGRSTTELSSQTGFFPLGKGTWLQANEALELQSISQTHYALESLEQLGNADSINHRRVGLPD